MEDKIKKVLEEKVNPLLADHDGGVKLVKYDGGKAYVKMTGACSSCPSAQFTVEDIIKGVVLEELPEIDDIVLDTSVSDDLIEMAKKILNKEI